MRHPGDLVQLETFPLSRFRERFAALGGVELRERNVSETGRCAGNREGGRVELLIHPRIRDQDGLALYGIGNIDGSEQLIGGGNAGGGGNIIMWASQ